MWDSTQLALLREAGIAGNSISAGLTTIRKANYAHPGLYSHAFFSLSIGLERMLKIIYIMDFLLQNNGKIFPTDKELRAIGHDIESLFDMAAVIKKKHKLQTEPGKIIKSDIEYKIIIFMSRFAKSTRYYNLDLLTGALRNDSGSDPIGEWFRDVGEPILKKHFKPRQEAKVRQNAQIIENLIGQYALVHHTAEDGKPLETVLSASYQTGMTEFIRKYGTLYCARICKYLYYIIYEMTHKCNSKNIAIPYLYELFFPFMNDDAYLLNRKTFPPRGQGF
jgi:hypothetical protein